MYSKTGKFFRTNLIDELTDRMGITKDYAKEFIRQYETIIKEVLESGEDIQFTNFLTFKIKVKPAYKHYDLRVGDTVVRGASYKLYVKPIGDFKNAIETQRVSKYEQRKYAHQESV